MPEQTLSQPLARGELSRWTATGIVCGAVSVLVFHQGAAAVLHALGLVPNAPFVLEPTKPLGVPVLWSMVFWGAVWGAVLAVTLSRLHGAALILTSVAFGAIFPTLVAWLVVAPLKERPIAIGVALVLNGLWGLGAGLGLALFGRDRRAVATRKQP